MKLASALLVAVSACTPFAASTGSIDAGTDSAVTSDGAAASEDDASPDSGTTPAGCTHDVCEDFNAAPPWAGWSAENLEMGAAGDDAVFVSAPRSFKATALAEPAGTIRSSYIERALPLSQHVVVSVQLRVHPLNQPNGEIDVLAVDVSVATAARTYFAIVSASDGKHYVEVQQTGGATKKESLGAIGPNFERFTLDIDFAGTVRASRGSDPMRVITIAPVVSTGVRVQAGVVWVNNSKGTWNVNVDDLTADAPP